MSDVRGGGPESLSSLVEGVLDTFSKGEASANARAAAAWNAANGDVERAHTTGTYLRPSRAAGANPVLGVFLDSRMRVVDFSANKELYLARLANHGLQVSDIEFKVDRLGRTPRPSWKEPVGTPVTSDDYPDLTPAEEAEVAHMVKDLPESVRRVAQKAVILSMRRERHLDTEN